jgi:hypothetical protein
LIDVFEKAEELVRRDGNDFSWSGWEDSGDALSEIHAIIAKLRALNMPANARVLFVPTGPLQELSLSSGWGDEFIRLADWYDDAEATVDCDCYSKPIGEFGEAIGTDARHADVFITRCAACGRSWLRYLYEFEFISKSGRWFLGPLRRELQDQVTPENALDLFEQMLWYFAGGSYYDGKILKVAGRPIL